MGSNYIDNCNFIRLVKDNFTCNDEILKMTAICMACLETGYGTSGLYRKGRALFGIKATKGWKGKIYNAKTAEVYNGINCTITASFRAYGSIKESCDDFIKLMKNKRYSNAWGKDTVLDCITAIKTAGYATDPDYILKVYRIYRNYNKVLTENTIYSDYESLYKIALDVIAGKYGNGEERKEKLGNKYNDVQKIVNKILS